MCNCKCTPILSQKGEKGDQGESIVGPQGPAGADGTDGTNGGQIEGTIVVALGTASLTEGETGSKVVLNRAAGSIITLPDTPADGTNYTFMTKTDLSSNNYQINTGVAGLDTFIGYLYGKKGGTADEIFQTASATHIIMNGTTTGGDLGTNVKVSYSGTENKWYVSGWVQGSGALVTPFS
jgi:hypothetical protein